MIAILSQAEMADFRDQFEMLRDQTMKDREEIDQVTLLYKVCMAMKSTLTCLGHHDNLFQAEQSQSAVLENALAAEKENFHRLKMALDSERRRSREAIDRDNDTILDLRTALEVERERARASRERGSQQFLMPSASTGNIPSRFRSLQGKHILDNMIANDW